MACRFMAVSMRVSPLLRALVSASKLMISAESRFSAISKLLRVRVRVLEEEVDDQALAQGRDDLDLGALADLLEGLGLVQDER